MSTKPTIGWREWIALPELDISQIKVKVDTGARSSSLHAFNVKEVRRGGLTRVRFDVHPIQRDDGLVIQCTAPLLGYREIKSSNGSRQERPVIRSILDLGGDRWPIEVTLTARDEMGFRMLLGREAVRGHFVVDPGRSYLMRDHVPVKSRRHRKRTITGRLGSDGSKKGSKQ